MDDGITNAGSFNKNAKANFTDTNNWQAIDRATKGATSKGGEQRGYGLGSSISIAKALGVMLEFIAYRTPEQNGSIESFHGRFKREYVWPQDFNTFQEANTAIADAFIDGRRPHSALRYIPLTNS